jgi:probable rRNA maturation factor
MECLIFLSAGHMTVEKGYVHTIVKKIFEYHHVDGTVSIHVIGDTRMRRLNNHYRHKDRTTDVLSFAMQEDNTMPFVEKDFGDIFISMPQIRRQARQHAISVKEELVRMVIHGVLHVLGYDHITLKEEKKMFGLQEMFVKKLV